MAKSKPVNGAHGIGALVCLVICVALQACAGTPLGAPDANLVPAGKVGDAAPAAAAKPDAAKGDAAAKSGQPSQTMTEKPKDPKDPKAALEYARALKTGGKPKEALVVLDKASEGSVGNRAYLVEHGLLALELGQAKKAQRLLSESQPAESRDWRVHSGLGVAYASQGQQSEAQKHLKKALELSKDNPSVLNNLAMSYILDRKVDEAETLLRQAAASGAPRQQVAQNLALVAALKTQKE